MPLLPHTPLKLATGDLQEPLGQVHQAKVVLCFPDAITVVGSDVWDVSEAN